VEGLGISRIVRTFCAAEVKQGKLVEVLPEFQCAPLVFYALLPGRRLMPPKVRVFLESLKL
jgi:DNA-binding transcriptional LysR family regulator